MAKIDYIYDYVAANGGQMVARVGRTNLDITVIANSTNGRIVTHDGKSVSTPTALVDYLSEHYIAPEVDGSDGIGNAANTIFGGYNMYNHIVFGNGVSFGDIVNNNARTTRRTRKITVKETKVTVSEALVGAVTAYKDAGVKLNANEMRVIREAIEGQVSYYNGIEDAYSHARDLIDTIAA